MIVNHSKTIFAYSHTRMKFLTVKTAAVVISVQISLTLVFTGEPAVIAITAVWSAAGNKISIIP